MIDAKSMTMNYQRNKDSAIVEVIGKSDMHIEKANLNFSEVLADKQYMTEGFDFEKLDISSHLNIQVSPIMMNFKQEAFTYFLRTMDLNINNEDGNMKDFQLAVWNNPDLQKYVR